MKIVTAENHKDEPEMLLPVVDLNKCEAEGVCMIGCPYDVFEMQNIHEEDYKKLSFVGKVKTIFHGDEKALVARPEQCHACGICVMACPEDAIKLTKVV